MSARAGVPSLRERKKSQTRVAIHEAALRLVVENGAENTSVDAICSEAGVSSRTFFNYFPSKVSAILGVEGLVITDEARAAFLAGDGERDLVPDLCALVATLGDTVTARQERREALHDLLVRRPELVRDVFFLMTDVRKQVIELAAERTTLERARLATTLVFAATGYAMERAEERPAEDLGVWLLQTVRDMSALVGDSLD